MDQGARCLDSDWTSNIMEHALWGFQLDLGQIQKELEEFHSVLEETIEEEVEEEEEN